MLSYADAKEMPNIITLFCILLLTLLTIRVNERFRDGIRFPASDFLISTNKDSETSINMLIKQEKVKDHYCKAKMTDLYLKISSEVNLNPPKSDINMFFINIYYLGKYSLSR